MNIQSCGIAISAPTAIVADDDLMVRDVLSIHLQRQGFCVWEASNGKEAITLAEKAPPQLVVLDIFMPEADGLETLKQLKRRFPMSKILMVSGSAQIGRGCDYLKMAFKLGADGILQKPFTPDELYCAVESCFAR